MARIWLAVLALLIAASFRLNRIAYGLDDVCLTVPEETWLYDADQSVSLYTWNVAPRGALEFLPGRVRSAPLVTVETMPLDRLLVRLAGAAAGLLTAAAVMRLGRGLRANGWWAAGLLVAVSPWFVAADRWMVRFDGAALAVAVAALALWGSKRDRSGWQHAGVVGLHAVAALSLLVIAPPLWWLAFVLLALHPSPRWTLFVLLVGIALIPGLQTPELWLKAAQSWDVGVTAACILAGLALALWWKPRLKPLPLALLYLAVAFAGGMTLAQDSALKQPDAAEWALIRWLQTRIPDDAPVRFDFATWPLASVVACPAGAQIDYRPQSSPVEFFEVRNLEPPYYSVAADPTITADMPHITQIADRFWVGRGLELANQVDIGFGGLVYLLGYELLTPILPPGGSVDLRIDYQFGANITPDVLAYAAFVHVTPKADPATNWVNYTDPFFAESGNTGSRRVMLNRHLRFSLPPDIPIGDYDLRFGIFNFYTGEHLGDTLVLGEIRVS